MADELFVAVCSLFTMILFRWSFHHLPQEKWQFLAAVPTCKGSRQLLARHQSDLLRFFQRHRLYPGLHAGDFSHRRGRHTDRIYAGAAGDHSGRLHAGIPHRRARGRKKTPYLQCRRRVFYRYPADAAPVDADPAPGSALFPDHRRSCGFSIGGRDRLLLGRRHRTAGLYQFRLLLWQTAVRGPSPLATAFSPLAFHFPRSHP